MKIERVNEHQIRCTLTREDLANRQIKISELAYGTDKAKDLFRDMMQQASFQFGFNAEDIPLMIEAIPINAECIVLIITKVDDPEELDTRFSNFSPSVIDGDEETDDSFDSSDDVMGLFKKLQQDDGSSASTQGNVRKNSKSGNITISDEAFSGSSQTFIFDALFDVTRASEALNDGFSGRNSLYKNDSTGKYYLVVNKDDLDAKTFSKICFILSEYGSNGKTNGVSQHYLEEHFDLVIQDDALQKLNFIK
ncbi:MAG: adaptor protein MecA [Butyrivibrio sp.]|nr:adaptor protein MecA [Butyrivibrio sp.]